MNANSTSPDVIRLKVAADQLLGAYYASNPQLGDCVTYSTEAADVSEKQLGVLSPETIRAKALLALCEVVKLDTDKGLALATTVNEVASHVPQLNAADHATILSAYSLALLSSGRITDAVAPMERALDWRMQSSPMPDADAAQTMGTLAFIYQAQGRFGAAEDLFRRSLDITKTLKGADSRQTLAAEIALGNFLIDTNQSNSAWIPLNNAFESSTKMLEPTDPIRLNSTMALANLNQAMGDLPNAETRYKVVIDAKMRTVGLRDRDTLAAMNRLGRIYQAEAKLPQAEQLFRQVYDERMKLFGLSDVSTALSANDLGWLYAKTGKLEDSRRLLAEAISVRKKFLESEIHRRSMPRTIS